VLTLAAPRTDDPLAGIEIPVSGMAHPGEGQPSVIQQLHAEKVSTLPLRNQQGSYDEHEMPDLPTSAAASDYIQTRTAAWRQHQERRQKKQAKLKKAQPQPAKAVGKAAGPRNRRARRARRA
jgi:phospholipase C